MAVDDAPTNGESDSGAGVFSLIVQALEYFEYFFLMFRRNADAIVAQRENPLVLHQLRREVNARRCVLGAILDRVADQILYKLDQLRPVSIDCGEVTAKDLCIRFAHRRIKELNGIVEYPAHGHWLEGARLGIDVRIIEQVAGQRLQISDGSFGAVDPVDRLGVKLVRISGS